MNRRIAFVAVVFFLATIASLAVLAEADEEPPMFIRTNFAVTEVLPCERAGPSALAEAYYREAVANFTAAKTSLATPKIKIRIIILRVPRINGWSTMAKVNRLQFSQPPRDKLLPLLPTIMEGAPPNKQVYDPDNDSSYLIWGWKIFQW